MKSIKLFFLIFLLTNSCLGQNTITGNVKDKLTNKGISFASISLKNKTIGTYTNEEGSFELKVTVEDSNDSLLIGCLGYEKVTLSVNDITKQNNISLMPVNYKLPEITITPNNKSKIHNMELGHLKGKPYAYIAGNVNGLYTLTAIFIDNPNLENAFVKELLFTFEPKYQEGNAFIKVHLFEKDQYSADTRPGKELMPENFIVTVKPKTKTLRVDIQKYNIKMPYNGLFVGFEWIKGNITQKYSRYFFHSGVSPVYRGMLVAKPIPTFRKFMEHDWKAVNVSNFDKQYYVPRFGLNLIYEKDKR
jgi:CarboxypepD_reg-like domain